MSNKPYIKILKSLRKHGIGKRVEALTLLNENLGDSKQVWRMVQSLSADGLIRHDRILGFDNGEIQNINIEITKEGIEHLDRVNIYLFAKISLAIAILSLIFSIFTYSATNNKSDGQKPKSEQLKHIQ